MNRAVVVGAGPAGLRTALALVEAGWEAVVLEKAVAGPIDKPCGEGLMPGAVQSLRRAGLDPEALGGRAFFGIAYVDGGWRAQGSFPGPSGVGLRRVALHRGLLERARAVGIEIRWEHRVEAWRPGRVEAAGTRFEADLIVAADGARSRLRAWAGLARPARRQPLRFGARRHFALEPWCDRVEVHFGPGAEAYVTPVGEREVGVALLWDGDRRLPFAERLEELPVLASRLKGAVPTSGLAGRGPLRQGVRSGVGPALALVGDAAGYRDAITGEGLESAFDHAEALASCATGGSLVDYERRRRRIDRGRAPLLEALLVIKRHPRLRRRLVASLAADPWLFDRFLALHVGQRTPAYLPLAVARLLAGALRVSVPAAEAPTRAGALDHEADREQAEKEEGLQRAG